MRKTYTVGEKQALIEEAKQCGIRETAKKHRIRQRLLEKWMKKETDIQETANRNPKAKSTNRGRPIQNPEVQNRALLLIQDRRSHNVPIKAQQLIDYVLTLDGDFHSGNMDALFSWAYRLMKKPSEHVSLKRLKRKRNEIENNEKSQIATHRRKILILVKEKERLYLFLY